jgi:hypothetical protein
METQHSTWRNKISFSVGIRWLGGRSLHNQEYYSEIAGVVSRPICLILRCSSLLLGTACFVDVVIIMLLPFEEATRG